jgi:hypothetical protein
VSHTGILSFCNVQLLLDARASPYLPNNYANNGGPPRDALFYAQKIPRLFKIVSPSPRTARLLARAESSARKSPVGHLSTRALLRWQPARVYPAPATLQDSLLGSAAAANAATAAAGHVLARPPSALRNDRRHALSARPASRAAGDPGNSVNFEGWRLDGRVEPVDSNSITNNYTAEGNLHVAGRSPSRGLVLTHESVRKHPINPV